MTVSTPFNLIRGLIHRTPIKLRNQMTKLLRSKPFTIVWFIKTRFTRLHHLNLSRKILTLPNLIHRKPSKSCMIQEIMESNSLSNINRSLLMITTQVFLLSTTKHSYIKKLVCPKVSKRGRTPAKGFRVVRRLIKQELFSPTAINLIYRISH